jgi:hypothetical protein
VKLETATELITEDGTATMTVVGTELGTLLAETIARLGKLLINTIELALIFVEMYESGTITGE